MLCSSLLRITVTVDLSNKKDSYDNEIHQKIRSF